MALLGIVIFTVIETLILTAWLALLKVGTNLPLGNQLAAVAVLTLGLLLEHVVAYNVGKDRPPFSFPV